MLKRNGRTGMIEHSSRVLGVIKAHLKTISLGDDVGYTAVMGLVFGVNPETKEQTIGPGWTVLVTLRNPLLGQNDIGTSIPISAVLPTDDMFKQAAAFLLEKCREERDKVLHEKPAAVGMRLG
jgi:hypothetical protein